MRIININTTGMWQPVPIPNNTVKVQVQARGAVAVNLRYADDTTVYWTIKANTVFEETGLFRSTTFQVNAANGNVVEISCQMTGVPG